MNSKHKTKIPSRTWRNGLRAHDWVKDLVISRGRHRLLVERWRAPVPVEEGLGEIDLVFHNEQGEGVAVEVKSFSLHHNAAGLAPVTPRQLQRLRRSLRYLRVHYAFRSLRFFLALVDLETGRVEFLENPC